ncbi:F0F1 ATP synthase subunit beta, partial [Mesomycoplasma ovipneumoniae]|nr:F0F1 ATP synthase subunit beta [Mesomycoplasma ovipneumoniae]
QFIKIEDTVNNFDELLSGKFDNVPEEAFLYVGTINQALEKAKKMGWSENN